MSSDDDIPLCADCAFVQRFDGQAAWRSLCGHAAAFRAARTNAVVGGVQATDREGCLAMREDGGACGRAGSLFVPLTGVPGSLYPAGDEIFCRDCRWCRPTAASERKGRIAPTTTRCGHEAAQKPAVVLCVTGDEDPQLLETCGFMRGGLRPCGPEAMLFEPWSDEEMAVKAAAAKEATDKAAAKPPPKPPRRRRRKTS